MSKYPKKFRFEVDYKQRLEQQRTATDAVRLPKLGYKQYRVYNEVLKKDKGSLNVMYGQHIGRVIRNSPSHYWTIKMQIITDELILKKELKFVVKWLKPKTATMLRLKGRRVEEVL